MSAARHLHPDQLSMFIPAGHLADPSKTEHADLGYEGTETHADLHRIKVAESKRYPENRVEALIKGVPPSPTTLHESITQHGVKEPVSLSPYGPTLMDGHHRVFTAAEVNPKMEVPVEWWD